MKDRLRIMAGFLLVGFLSACELAAEPANDSAAKLINTPVESHVAEKTDSEQAIRAALEKAMPGFVVEDIRPSPVSGWHEVAYGSEIAYVSEQGRFLMTGSIIDLHDMQNLTNQAKAVRNARLLLDLQDKDTILFSPENPDHVVTVFTDANCGYCRKLHQQIDQYMAKGIAIRYASFPALGQNSYDMAKQVWCAKDRKTALTEAKQGVKVTSDSCDDPIDEQFALGQALGVRGTPSMFSQSGHNIAGYLPPAQLLAELNKRKGKQK